MKGFLYGKTEYSILSCSVKLDDYIQYAKENSFDFLTITDFNMHGAYKFYRKCTEAGIKPVLGLEYGYSVDLHQSKIILYAKNNQGYRNLVKISSDVNINNEDSLEYLKKYCEDFYTIFVFNDSYLEQLLYSRDFINLDRLLGEVKALNGYIGISYTNKISKININNEMADYAKKQEIPAIEIHECRYLENKDSDVYSVLRKIDGKEEEIGEFDDYSFLANPEEQAALNEMIENIHLDLFNEHIALPKFPNTKGVSSEEYLRALCFKGLEKRGKSTVPVYQERLKYELSVISKMGYNDYFLIVWDFIRYSKQNGILVGPGRGSAAGSLVAYSLGITDVNPLDYDLLFERFLNPERVSMPDIDTDFPDDKRDKVIEYVRDLYGKNHVCNITTFGTFQLKSSVKDLARVTKIDSSRVDKLAGMVEEYGFDKLIEEYDKSDPEIAEFLRIARKLEGLPRNISTHAAGIILSDLELSDIVPLSPGINGLYQSQYEAPDLESIGLLKMDFLGLSNLTMIDGMMRDCHMTRGELMNIPLDDQKVYRMLSSGDTLGIFQLESPGIRRVLQRLRPTDISDLVAVLALYRPGPMDNIPDFIKRRHGEEVVRYPHPDLSPILRSTYGVIIYQEQIMQIARQFAGFSLGEADLLRRAVSKKNASKLDALKNEFVTRSVKKGYKEETAQQIYDLIYKFANYGFNKSHSVVYSYISYQMAWFKVNHFPEFMANMLNNVVSSKETLNSYIRYAITHGLSVKKPDINVSGEKFIKYNNELYLPITAVSGLGKIATGKILEERNKGRFESFNDFISRTGFLNKSSYESLIYSGALDSFGKTKMAMMQELERDTGGFSEFINNVETKNEFEFDVLAENEKKYLGMNLEYNIFRGTEGVKKHFNAVEINKLPYDTFVNVICAFSKIKIVKTKKDQTDMLTGTIYDEMGELPAVMFSNSYLKCLIKLKTNHLYVVRGSMKKNRDNEDQFSIFSINELM